MAEIKALVQEAARQDYPVDSTESAHNRIDKLAEAILRLLARMDAEGRDA